MRVNVLALSTIEKPLRKVITLLNSQFTLCAATVLFYLLFCHKYLEVWVASLSPFTHEDFACICGYVELTSQFS